MPKPTNGQLVVLFIVTLLLAGTLALLWPRGHKACPEFTLASEHLPEVSQAFRLPYATAEGVVLLYRPSDDNVFSHRSLSLLRILHDTLGQDLVSDDLNEPQSSFHVESLSNAYVLFPEHRPPRMEALIPNPIPNSAGMLNAIGNRAAGDADLEWRLFSADWTYGALIIHTEGTASAATGSSPLARTLREALDSPETADHFEFYLLAPESLLTCPD
ncbi:MAG: hypothetical protein LAT62_05200 [Natronospirillum sp.]|uniref:hypothetical protein n=1 Tax=Natronospirillum sp. TaxID=2812955 RepID=UPI0025D49A24|nr:hypothetical protein [Natronospirillum sp.]MCH8551312.1 hypothetical protein [Natronospirillum sp.]